MVRAGRPAALSAPVSVAESRSRPTSSSRSGTAASICSSETSVMLTPPTCIVAASIGAIGALLDVGGAHPWWALGIFAVCVVCIHGLVVLGEPKEV